jgi:hypothetical protein
MRASLISLAYTKRKSSSHSVSVPSHETAIFSLPNSQHIVALGHFAVSHVAHIYLLIS